jgi:ribosome biogenesis GTPase
VKLSELGYSQSLDDFRKENDLEHLSLGRVVLEHKERYIVKNQDGEFDSEILGHLRFTASKRSDFPAVGDWVAFQEFDRDKGIIHSIFPRKTIIERQAVGKHGEKQIIATNIDVALIVQAIDRDFNINRIQRYLTICNSSGIDAIIILNKIDLIKKEDLNRIIEAIRIRIFDVLTIAISNQSKEGYETLQKMLLPGKTYCLLGSSGVGKSTLTNNISGKDLMKTDNISDSTNKGKHVTSHRELVVLPSGAILIDNPGMREVGVVTSDEGIAQTFEVIQQYAEDCKFGDCTHLHEKGCAVLEALENEEISQESYGNYIKLEKEKEYFDSTELERRQKDKAFGKMIKQKLNEKKKFK